MATQNITKKKKKNQVQREDEIWRFGFNCIHVLEAVFLLHMTEAVSHFVSYLKGKKNLNSYKIHLFCGCGYRFRAGISNFLESQ